MSKKFLFLLIGIIYLILIATGLTLVYSVGAPHADEKKVTFTASDGKIIIAHTEIFGTLQRPHVVFDHKRHEEAMKQEGCAACHPVNNQKKLVFTFPAEIKGEGWKAVMNAFHDECIGCHKERKAGPLTCNECHRKDLAKATVHYPKAEFDYADHYTHVRVMRDRFGKGDCAQCHHTYDHKEQKKMLKAGTEESCSYCHDLNKKRGPELAAVTKITAEKGLSARRVFHQDCLNCHLDYREAYAKMSDKETAHDIHLNKLQCADCHIPNSKEVVSCSSCHIPTDCAKCHTGKYKSISDLRNTPRPDRGQKDMMYISIENSRMNGVPFNHKTHETYSKTCTSCHHESLKACKDCHSLTGKTEGNGINIAKAYHQVFSDYSCAGCHKNAKAEKECAGCHYYLSAMDIETMNPRKDTCAICHSGRKDISAAPKPLSAPGVVGNVSIGVLQNEFEPVTFPHGDIVNTLVKISNESRLATYFHRDIQAICSGCHHNSAVAAEAQKGNPPNCRSCHMVKYDTQDLHEIRLLTAYHGQCVGCHDKMGIERGSSLALKQEDRCTACHRAKPGGPTEITGIKNENAVRQNTTASINAWRPK